MMDSDFLVPLFERESALLDSMLREHPRLRPVFAGDANDSLAYLQLLKATADYVQHTVPALRAAGLALQSGDDEDRAWSERFLGYAIGETDDHGSYGHHVWALADMRALGATPEQLAASPHPIAVAYGRYFVDDAQRHPYAILGAKGVLEHLSIRASDDIVRGMLATAIANASDAVTFFRHHGVLDLEHVRDGDRNVMRLRDPAKRQQVVEGAWFTSGAYRSLIGAALSATSLAASGPSASASCADVA
jgi:hypothetical protein